MTAKVCLRCDWSGVTTDDTCPRCGAGLFASARTTPGEGARPPDTPLTERRTERSWRGTLAAALVALLAIGAVVFVQRHTPPAAVGATPTGRAGFLLTTAPEGSGARMWIWDLGANTATQGPLLDVRPDELVYGYEVHGGWVGITTGGATEERASVLRYLGPGDQPVSVASGDAIAWSPSTSSVSVLRTRPAGACTRITVSTWFVSIRRSLERFDGVRCGEPTAFARDRNLPYITLEHDEFPTTLRIGAGYMEPIVHGYRLLSVSAEGDLLVQRPGGGLALAYLSPQGTRPVPIGKPGTPLDPIRVLAWSEDASDAFVFGTVGGVQGIFRITVGPRPRPRRPVLLLVTNAVDLQATPTADGGLYVLTDGAISLVQGTRAESIAPPPGAPIPVGPVLWVATLPYSPAEG